MYFSSLFSQEITGTWKGGGYVWSTDICDFTITTSVEGVENGAFVSLEPGGVNCNDLNVFSSNLVAGSLGLKVLFRENENNTESGVLKFVFSKPVRDPILHIDQLGEWDYLTLFKAVSISVKLTLDSSGLTLTQLSGNGSHFNVSENSIDRTISRTFDKASTDMTFKECGISSQGSAAGSVQINGTVNEVSFLFEVNSIDELNQDSVVFAWEVSCVNDIDGDGVADLDDLDDDNDGILDVDELKGNLLLDTDNDGLIDSIDRDSDNDGCYDVLEAGYDDPDQNGTLGSAPDQVDSEGRIIGEVQGYSLLNDLDMNSVPDFQEQRVVVYLVQPKDKDINGGDDAVISASVEGAASLQWQVSYNSGITWFDIQEDSVFSGVTSENLSLSSVPLAFNGYLFRLKDEFCGIENFSKEAGLKVSLSYPKFFTPNNDYKNDYWGIKGLEGSSYVIIIYNRYGKMLKTLTNNSKGWDGRFNNELMPSSDYWFKYRNSEGAQLIGHFTLKQ